MPARSVPDKDSPSGWQVEILNVSSHGRERPTSFSSSKAMALLDQGPTFRILLNLHYLLKTYLYSHIVGLGLRH